MVRAGTDFLRAGSGRHRVQRPPRSVCFWIILHGPSPPLQDTREAPSMIRRRVWRTKVCCCSSCSPCVLATDFLSMQHMRQCWHLLSIAVLGHGSPLRNKETAEQFWNPPRCPSLVFGLADLSGFSVSWPGIGAPHPLRTQRCVHTLK